MGEMPKADVLARCHMSGKTTVGMTQEILCFPLRWLRRPSQHMKEAENREEIGSACVRMCVCGGGGGGGLSVKHTSEMG